MPQGMGVQVPPRAPVKTKLFTGGVTKQLPPFFMTKPLEPVSLTDPVPRSPTGKGSPSDGAANIRRDVPHLPSLFPNR